MSDVQYKIVEGLSKGKLVACFLKKIFNVVLVMSLPAFCVDVS